MKIIYQVILVASLAASPTLHSEESDTANAVQHKLSLSTAIIAAKASISSCSAQGINVSVSVVDSNGLLQVLLKSDLSSPLSTTLSQRKAFTAANFRKDTTQLADRSDTAVGRSEGVLMSAGGVTIKLDDVVYGAIGVSGADTGAKDDECAKAGLLSIVDLLKKKAPAESESIDKETDAKKS